MTNPFDGYALKAWVYPGLLAAVPMIALVAGWWPDLLSHKAIAGAASLAVACGMVYAASSVIRERGRKIELRLLQKWGGWPTTISLRHHGSPLDGPTADRYRRYLSERVPALRLPSPAEETEDPAAADAIYGSAVAWLRSRAHANAHRMVAHENASYGFRRNTLGLRTVGVAFALAALVASSLSLWGDLVRNGRQLQFAPAEFGPTLRDLGVGGAASLLVALLMLLFWGFVVRENWVRQAADRYARELLATCDYPDPKA